MRNIGKLPARQILMTALLVALLSLAACKFGGQEPENQQPENNVTEEPATPIAQGTPALDEDAQPEANQTESPLAQPESPLAFTSPLATEQDVQPYVYGLEYDPPESDKGHVIGRITTETPPDESAYYHGDLLLGSILYGTGEVQPAFLSIDVGSAPSADERTENDEFIFLNVEPGEYGLIMYTFLSYYVAPDETGEVLMFEVKPGEVIDIGEFVLP